MKQWFLPLVFGTATGILSSWGVGGGTLLLLLMTLFLGVDQVEAQGINLLYFLPTAAASLFFHQRNGYLDRNALCSAAPLGSLAALAAAVFATNIDISIFRKPFGLFLLVAGVLLLFRRNPECR